MSKQYEIQDLSGDAALRVFGSTLEALFIHAANGLYALMTENSVIEDSASYNVSTQAEDMDSLLVQWLNELLFLFDAYSFVGKTFQLNLTDHGLDAVVTGGLFDPETHERGLLVKAATYHQLSIKKTASGYEAMVIFDL
ncbi:MAG TPA: archease [Thermodesulfovibrionia bacterium]|nr:archease [Thermodesulfovibrionia bacterium]